MDPNYEVKKIQGSDGQEVNLEKPEYLVNENTTYDFSIEYTKKGSEEILTSTQDVSVGGLATAENQISPEMGITPATVETDQGLTLSIPEYDGVGWGNGAIKTVNVSVDFADVTSSNKRVEITLPEGMRYELISINGTANLTGVDTGLISYYGSTDPLYTAITGITLPKKETPTNSTFGKMVFNFSEGTEKATLSFKASIDRAKYYGPHTVPNPIEAIAYEGAAKDVVGQTEQVVKAIGGAIGGNHTGQTYGGTPNLLTSKPGNIKQDITHYLEMNGLYDASNTGGISSLFVKKVETTVAYPVGTELIGLTNARYQQISNDPTTGTATYETTGEGSYYVNNLSYRVPYRIPVGLPAGVYTNSQKDKVTYTWYDGTTQTFYINGNTYSVNVMDSFPNKATIGVGLQNTVNTGIADQLVYQGSIQVSNSQGSDLTNQTFEMNAEPNFKVSRIFFPYEKFTGNNVSQIYCKTNKNDTWREYTGSLTTVNTLISSISKSQAGLRQR